MSRNKPTGSDHRPTGHATGTTSGFQDRTCVTAPGSLTWDEAFAVAITVMPIPHISRKRSRGRGGRALLLITVHMSLLPWSRAPPSGGHKLAPWATR